MRLCRGTVTEGPRATDSRRPGFAWRSRLVGDGQPCPTLRLSRRSKTWLDRALPAYDDRRVREIADLLEYLCTYILQNQLIRSRPATWAERLSAYVREHAQERLTVDELAAAAGYSRSFVTHRFRRQFGCTLRQYVQRARMRQAQVLLRKGCSVKETAYRLGFCDQFHFSKAYKAWSGKPPSAVGE